MMAELAEKALQEPYPLSGVPLVLDDGAWSDWMPPEDHPLHRRFKHIETNWLTRKLADTRQTCPSLWFVGGARRFRARRPGAQRMVFDRIPGP